MKTIVIDNFYQSNLLLPNKNYYQNYYQIITDTQSRLNILNIHRNNFILVFGKRAKSKLEMLHRTNFIS